MLQHPGASSSLRKPRAGSSRAKTRSGLACGEESHGGGKKPFDDLPHLSCVGGRYVPALPSIGKMTFMYNLHKANELDRPILGWNRGQGEHSWFKYIHSNVKVRYLPCSLPRLPGNAGSLWEWLTQAFPAAWQVPVQVILANRPRSDAPHTLRL